jgi:hypothetical protein
MKNINLFLAIFLTLLSFLSFSTTSFGQYSSQFQGAKSVGKGNAELTAFYSNVGAAYNGESDKVFNNFGFQSGIGMSKLTEIRVRYDRFNYHEGDGEGVNTLMVGPKFSTSGGKFAFYLPFGFNFGNDLGNNWMADPTLIFSLPLGEKVNLNLTPGYMFTFEEGSGIDDGLLKLNLGFGINLGEGWVIRPEGGLLYFVSDFDGNFYNFGLGLSKKLIKQN